MIYSLFSVDIENNKKIFRSTKPQSISKINYIFSEFISSLQHVIYKDLYNYVSIGLSNTMFIVAQISKDHSISEVNDYLEKIRTSGVDDLFDILISFDNILYNGYAINDDIQMIKSMDSQDEKIHELMLEHRKQERKELEKEYKRQRNQDKLIEKILTKEKFKNTFDSFNEPVSKILTSDKPVIISLKETVDCTISSENFIKENSVKGELNLTITDEYYQNIKIMYCNIIENAKFSPFLDKELLKEKILKVNKNVQTNKKVPLVKYTTKHSQLPISIDCWSSNEDGQKVDSLTFTASKDIKNLYIQFNTKKLTRLEIDGRYDEINDEIRLNCGTIKKDDSIMYEIKHSERDPSGIFPLSLSFETDMVSNLKITKVFSKDDQIDDFDFIKDFTINSYIIEE
ncbi:COPD3 [Hepatospora eriocheir]|uniref:Coatomer subunit delta n=1 Tax=Hepatospora eriocheir TaxID=1081669 RepID=A0A1X0Q8L3_9MICR|nr:COPD3 [Hepatospora eriocheir]